jgi:hypothetical protein
MGGKRRPPFGCYAKRWDPKFSEARKPKKEGSYVQWKRKTNAVGDDLDLFLQDQNLENVEDSEPSREVEDVKEFCQGACLQTLKLGVGTVGQRRGAWLDDRSCAGLKSGRCAREYKNPLTAAELHLHLNEPV